MKKHSVLLTILALSGCGVAQTGASTLHAVRAEPQGDCMDAAKTAAGDAARQAAGLGIDTFVWIKSASLTSTRNGQESYTIKLALPASPEQTYHVKLEAGTCSVLDVSASNS